MGDRTFATDAESVHVGPVDPAGWDVSPHPVIDDADASAGVARRLQARIDRQLRLLEDDPEPGAVAELRELARRMRRDAESLLLLAGHEPGVPGDRPRRLGELLDAAVAAAERPERVTVPSPAHARIRPGAATELLHVTAELLDHATAVHPGARVELVSRIEGGGVAVEVRVADVLQRTPTAPDAQRSFDAAERLARRSRHGIAVRRELGDEGHVATVTAPSAAVLVDPVPRPTPARPSPAPLPYTVAPPDVPATNGHTTNGAVPAPAAPPAEPAAEPAGANNAAVTPATGIPLDEPPAVFTPKPGKIDELFGPLSDIPIDPADDHLSTPIFEAIASAWFRDDVDGDGSGGGSPLDWETPSAREWRDATERANHVEEAPLTSTGLPRRRPGSQLVPPPRSRSTAPPKPAERVPDRIRDRLSGYQRGLEQGRHRAESAPARTDPGDPEFW